MTSVWILIGAPLDKAEGAGFVEAADGCAVHQIESCRYSFTSTR